MVAKEANGNGSLLFQDSMGHFNEIAQQNVHDGFLLHLLINVAKIKVMQERGANCKILFCQRRLVFREQIFTLFGVGKDEVYCFIECLGQDQKLCIDIFKNRPGSFFQATGGYLGERFQFPNDGTDEGF